MTACERWEDALPDLAAGRLDAHRAAAVRAHVDTCPACRGELDLLRRLATTAASPPPDLEARIRVAVHGAARARAGELRHPASRRGRRRLAIPLAAAAGIGLLWIALPGPGADPAQGPAELTLAADPGVYGSWPAAGEEVAGAPVLSELSDETLETLLEEMEP